MCRRCRDSVVVCDGYATAPNSRSLAEGNGGDQQRVGRLLLEPQQLACPDVFSNVERDLFCRFQNYTKSAFSSLGPVEFWDHYVLPLTTTSEPVRYASIAVAAAHQLFLFRSAAHATSAQTPQMDYVTIQQYNKAIGYIRTLDTIDTKDDIQCVLVCCLLFVCLESMSGRYSESIRHFKAGVHLLATLQLKQDPGNLKIAGELADMFARFGIGISIFMEEAIMPRRRDYEASLHIDRGPGVSFSNFNEASLSLRRIDADYIHLMFSGRDSSLMDRDVAFQMLEDRLAIWSSRFDETVKAMQYQVLSDADQEQIMQMRLTQRLWQLFLPFDSTCQLISAPTSFSTFLDEAENLAKPFIAMKCPTFSVGGDLVGGLSLVTTLTTDPQIRSRALDLLRSLNRREGVWDSRDIIELHEATLSHEDSQHWYTRDVEGGIPGYMRLLAGATPAMNLSNAILRMTSP